ncbi:MAG: hypothetical protein DSM106950_11910 [Stigonema ocellatum SAG 48.90 = DSM 106950]|nr:hypothetical protein [Stigonema ocellatum SAG 48.90 = DSM 106950]
MQPKDWKNLSFWISWLASIGATWHCTRVDAARVKNPNLWGHQDDLVSIITLNPEKLVPSRSQPETLEGQLLGQPPLEGQPTNDFPGTSSTPIQPSLKTPPESDFTQRHQRLLQLLQKKKQQPPESKSNGELGRLLLRQRQLEQLPEPPLAPPVAQTKPIGYLQAHVGYFQTSNIFSSVHPIQDGLIFSGLTLASVPLRLGSKTYLNGSIDGYLIRYINQSKYNYDQLRFNLDIYQQLTPRMYGDFGWTNQQLFYAKNSSTFSAGDRFLSDNSLHLSLGRRDPLTPKLMLDSFYELRLSFTDPPSGRDNRNRVINSLQVSLNYYWQKLLQVGVDYQFGLSNFTERQREDQYHRLFGHLTYGISNYSNISLEGGVNLGSSTDHNIDFNGWFFTLNYNLELGRF